MTDVDRRAREQCAQAHLIVVQKLRKQLAPYLKDLAGPWIGSFFDPSKEVVRCTTEAWNEAFPSPQKKTDALVFVQPAVLGYVGTNVLEHTPETLSDARFVTPVEMEDKHTRVVSSSLKTLGYLVKELSVDQRGKCLNEYGKMFDVPKFWALTTPPAASAIRRSAYELISTLVTQWREVLEERMDKLLPVFPGKSFADQDPGVHGDMWQAILLFTKAFPDSWSPSSSATSKSKDKTVTSRLLSFLSRGCYGSSQASYPCLFSLLFFLPPTIIGGKFFEDFFDALWAGASTVNVDRLGTSALISAYCECVSLAASKLGEDQESAAKILSTAVNRMVTLFLNPLAAPEMSAKVTAHTWVEAIAKLFKKLSTAKQAVPGSSAAWQELLAVLRKGLETPGEIPDFGLFCTRSGDLLAAIGEASESESKELQKIAAESLDLVLRNIGAVDGQGVPALGGLARKLLSLVKNDAQSVHSISIFFDESFRALIKSADVPVDSLEPLVNILCHDKDLRETKSAALLKTVLSDLDGMRRLELAASFVDHLFESRDNGVPTAIPELDEYVEHLMLQRLGKLPLSEASEALISKIVSRCLAGGFVSQASAERVCSFVSGWLGEFVSGYLTVSSGGETHSAPALGVHWANSVLQIFAFATKHRAARDMLPHSVQENLFLEVSDLAAFSPASSGALDFEVIGKDGNAVSDSRERALAIQNLAKQLVTPLEDGLWEPTPAKHAREVTARWWNNFNDLRHVGTPGDFAVQLAYAFAKPVFPTEVKAAWIEAALFNANVRRDLAETYDCSDSRWLKLGADPVPRAFLLDESLEPEVDSPLHDVHGLPEYTRRISTVLEIVREVSVSTFMEMDLPAESDEDETPAVRLFLDLLDFQIAQSDSELGLGVPLTSDGSQLADDVATVVDAVMDCAAGSKPRPNSLAATITGSSPDSNDEFFLSAVKATLREARSLSGKLQVRACRRLRRILQLLKAKHMVAAKDLWAFLEAADKAQRGGDQPLGVLVAAADVAVAPSAEVLVAFQSQLMNRLASLDVKSALTGSSKEGGRQVVSGSPQYERDLTVSLSRSTAFDLLVPLNASFESHTTKSHLPAPRIVFLLRQIGQWFGETENQDAALLAELAALLRNLASIVADVDGAHWKFMVSRSIEWLRISAAAGADCALRHHTYSLVRTLLDLSKDNNVSIAEAVDTSHKELYAGLFSSYLGDWKDATGPAGTNQLEESSRALVAELCQHVPHDVLVPAGRFDELCAMLRSSVEWDQKTAAILLNRETIERVQAQSLKIEMAKAPPSDDGEGPRFQLPLALVELAKHRPHEDIEALFESGSKATEGLTYLLSWYVLLQHFGDITFQLKAAYVRHVRDTDDILPELLDYIMDTLAVGTPEAFDLSVWDFTEFDLSVFDPTSSFSYRLLAAHITWLAMRNMPTLVRSWWTDIKDKQLSMGIERWVVEGDGRRSGIRT